MRIASGFGKPVKNWALIVGALALTVAMPLWRELTRGHHGLARELSTELERFTESSGLLDKNHALLAAMDRFETRLDETSPSRQALLSEFQWLLLRYGGRGNESVTIDSRGEQPQLYLRTNFEQAVGQPFLEPGNLERRVRSNPSWSPPISPDPRPALLDFHRQLQARGIPWILLPVPSKASFGLEGTTLRNPSIDDLLATLTAAGVHIFDPTSVLEALRESGVEPYLRTDSHWSPAGLDAVTKALVEHIETMQAEGLIDLPTADRSWTRTAAPHHQRGDLWSLLSLPEGRAVLAPESVETFEVTSWDGLLWSAERGAPVMLLGDSFSTVFSDPTLFWGKSAGFGEQLAYFLGRDVDSIARPSGSSNQVRRDMARQPERWSKTRLVIYQVATRKLSHHDWPLVPLLNEAQETSPDT